MWSYELLWLKEKRKFSVFFFSQLRIHATLKLVTSPSRNNFKVAQSYPIYLWVASVYFFFSIDPILIPCILKLHTLNTSLLTTSFKAFTSLLFHLVLWTCNPLVCFSWAVFGILFTWPLSDCLILFTSSLFYNLWSSYSARFSFPSKNAPIVVSNSHHPFFFFSELFFFTLILVN